MDENKRKLYRQAARYSSVGLEMGIAVAIGVSIGYYLDRTFNTQPWLMIVFLLLGVAAGFRGLFSLMKEIDKEGRKK